MFKAGIEIHQQLNTKKLFCSCDSDLNDRVLGEFTRVLRPVQSELGEYDAAALMESMKRRTFVYQVTENSCLVEMDEEPPHDVNMEALEVAVLVSLMFNCRIVDEVHFMRKIVIDGSNTTGFQRTALIGMDGYIDTKFGRISIRSVCLEEEAARKIDEKEGIAVYRLDRLGIPLIEITTGPDLKSPQEVKMAAQILGYALRSTKKVRRGLGSIRQDLNISTDGERVEVKGVSRLNLLEKIALYEMERQEMLSSLAEEIKRRNPDLEHIEILDVTDIFRETKSKLIRNGLQKGHRVLGIRVPGFSGLLKSDRYRFGKELAEVVKVIGIPGIFHSDELPNYGIGENEVRLLREKFSTGDNDAFIIIVAEENKGKEALLYVIQRIRKAINGVNPETRGPRDDGTTEFLRPLPGSERMYPETDVPPIRITEEMIERLKGMIPKSYEEAIRDISERYGISMQQAQQILDENREDDFSFFYSIYPDGNVIFRVLFNIIPEIEGEGLDVSSIDSGVLEKIFSALAEGRIVKEAIPYILRDFIANGRIQFDEFKPMDEDELQAIIESVVDENIGDLKSRNVEGALMGILMEKLRGRADGEMVNSILRRVLERRGVSK
ncbi:MAG: Glu-tRNA(Gln) amidotransferase subunit GatE [Thermoplasmatales archaeon]|nr:Glu-tRNA(Gln) amidotransferase subunit GatE [Thermoplasmatales archaeon]